MKTNPIKKAPAQGFALIVTLSLMILLTIIAVGLLTLSSISLRSSSQAEAMAAAKANARLALMIAIGEIQKELGPDQKISAVSEILNPSDSASAPLKHSHLTGVWNSRQEMLGAPMDYDQKKAFSRWLVSSSILKDLQDSGFVQTGSFDEPVMMVSPPVSGGQATYAGKVRVAGSNAAAKGAFAWWVGDENCKGFTNPVDSLAAAAAVPTVPDLLATAGTPGAYGMQSIIPAYPANTATSAKVITLGEMELASPAARPSKQWFHDLSPYARGLLTNVSKGGWRQDLNLYLEMPRPADPWPFTGTPVPGPNSKYALSEVNDYDVLAWKYLYNFYHLKERVAMDNGRPYLRSSNSSSGMAANDLTNPRWNAGVIRPSPVLIRALMFISFGSIPAPGDPTKQVLRFYVQPVITLWNPYNVDMRVEAKQLNYLFWSLPMTYKININGVFSEEYKIYNNTGGTNTVLNKSITLLAGETKMLCSISSSRAYYSSPHQQHFMEDVPFIYSQASPGGLRGGGGAGGTVSDQRIDSKGSLTDTVTLETTVLQWDNPNIAFYKLYPYTFDIRAGHNDGSELQYRTFQWGQKLCWQYHTTTPDIASPDKLTRLNKPSATFAEIANAPKPFMVVDIQLKALDEADLPNKAWRDCIPSFPFMGVTSNPTDVTPYLAGAYKLRFNTINSYQEASSYLQIAPDNPTHTYFGGSLFPASGQSWITDCEIPLAPFTSLSQLQHLPQTSVDNLYSSGYFFQNRAIGNSFASPGVPADKVKEASGFKFNLDQYQNESGGTITGQKFPGDYYIPRPNIDRSFAANHLLWDDYFFSSMAAKNDVLRVSSAKLGVAEVVRDFMEKGKPLPNQRFRPYLAEKSGTAITQLLLDGSEPAPTAYKNVAAYMTVDGAFNINSVSVQAWKTMLASAHQRDVVVMEGSGGAPKSIGKRKYVVSRFSMPNNDTRNATLPGQNAKWQGYHELTEAQISELAKAIVRQIKLRGPFRSLAEFINRRLAPETDERSSYGALQAALEDPAVTINDAFRLPVITAADLGNANFPNKSAALGPRYQGSPPTVTQADLLNTIGPLLNARSDTFTVRAYGEARDPQGKILATARCEAVVQRVPSYVDPAQLSTIEPSALNATNKAFGRRFKMMTFRWLTGNEI